MTQQQWKDPEFRRKSYGASEAAVWMGMHPRKTPLIGYLEKRGEREKPDLADNDFIWLGEVLEKPILDRYAERTSRKLRRPQTVFVHPEYDFIHAQADAIILGEPGGVDAKTSGMLTGYTFGDWGEPGTDQVPESVLVQCQQCMACSGRNFWDVPAVLGKWGFVIYTVPRDDELIDNIIGATVAMKERVEKGNPPDAETEHDLRLLYPKSMGKVELASMAAVETHLNAYTARKKEAEWKKIKESMNLQLKKELKAADTLVDQDGNILATWKTDAQGQFGQKQFGEEHPEMYEAYRGEPIRRFLVKPIKKGQ